MRMSVLWLKPRYTVKYILSPREIPWASPSRFHLCTGNISIPYRHNTDTISVCLSVCVCMLSRKDASRPFYHWFKVNLTNNKSDFGNFLVLALLSAHNEILSARNCLLVSYTLINKRFHWSSVYFEANRQCNFNWGFST